MLGRLVFRLLTCAVLWRGAEPARHWRDERPALLPDAIVHRAPELTRGEAP